MKDYLVHADDHAIEITCVLFSQARREAASLQRTNSKDVTIDQYEDNELTGTYWHYVDNKLVKVL